MILRHVWEYKPHRMEAQPLDPSGYLVICLEGCDLGDSAKCADLPEATKRVELHTHATLELAWKAKP